MRVNIDKRKRPVRKGFPAETCWNLPAGSYSEPARFPWLRQLEDDPSPAGPALMSFLSPSVSQPAPHPYGWRSFKTNDASAGPETTNR